MKKLLSMLLVVSILFAIAIPTSFADESNDRVEISFRVGESVLKINGNDVPVETPYVVGDGVTLVPLRVITEAFGATVGWDDATQTVTLDYPGVNIVLQIGNPIAEVNGKAETLLAAPELPNSSTMVPLRFISETFGAVVSYDEATEAILVVKDANADGSTVVGAITTTRIGDSYYGWSMENPTNMTMTERRFDGLSTTFAYDENNSFSIMCDLISEDDDLNRDFTSTKKYFSEGFTLAKAEMLSEANGYVIQAKDKESLINLYVYYTDKYYIELFGLFSAEATEARDEALRIMSTFTPNYTTEDTHDLSNQKDGMRTFSDEDSGLSFDIPSDFYLYSSETLQNEFSFAKLSEDDSISEISLSFYSISEVGDARTLAEKDHASNLRDLNEEVVTISEIKQTDYANISTYTYSIEVKNTSAYDMHMQDVFWQVGDYVYNLGIFQKAEEGNEDFAAYVDKVCNSIKAEPIKFDSMGIIMKNSNDSDELYTSKTKEWSLELPARYEEYSADNEQALYVNEKTSVVIQYITSEYNNANFTSAQAQLKETEAGYAKEADAKVVVITSATPKMLSGKQYAYDELKITSLDEDGEATDTSYLRQYVYPANKNEFHVFIVAIPEISHSKHVLAEIEQIISSFKLL